MCKPYIRAQAHSAWPGIPGIQPSGTLECLRISCQRIGETGAKTWKWWRQKLVSSLPWRGVSGEEVISLDSIHVKALYKKSLTEPAAL